MGKFLKVIAAFFFAVIVVSLIFTILASFARKNGDSYEDDIFTNATVTETTK